ncbi:MAG: nicotinate phosphoribosyltransferase [Bacteroidota bacterium]
MSRSEWVNDDNAALFTDLYELTMLQAYFVEEMTDDAVFDLFIRRLPERNYLLSAGLETVLTYLERLRFSEEAIAYLAGLDLFRDDFLEHLSTFRFTGNVYAMAEGTPFFADEPVLQVVAPIGEGQLVETFLLNQITFQTNLASKASRVVHAARGRAVADFGARRMHGTDAAVRGARAYHIAGVGMTSNVLAGHVFNLEVTGTMAHSYIEAYDYEADAFRAFAGLYPETTLLVDTYDTVEGVKRVIRLARQTGLKIGAVRLDSGDLAELAHTSRRLLDEADLEDVRIFASGSLDEYRITELLDQKAPIDGFGVGTSMGTSADQPYLDSAYKLCEYAGRPRMKLSSKKSNLPGLKQVFRFTGSDGRASHDVIGAMDENLGGQPLLECVMRDGQRTAAGRRSLDDARAHAERSLQELPEQLLSIEPADPPYEVRLSDRLQSGLEKLRSELERRQQPDN